MPHLRALAAYRAMVQGRMIHIESPPPIADVPFLEAHPGSFAELMQARGFAPALFRYKVWRLQSALYRETCAQLGVEFLPVPPEMMDDQGMMVQQAWNYDPTHGNALYGSHVLARIASMTHPYKSQPDAAFWSRAVAAMAPEAVNPAGAAPFGIAPTDAVVTAGSCFAQHIGPMLPLHPASSYLVTEVRIRFVDAEIARQFNYGVFSARYGNVYTARQLLQLIQRAYGEFAPQEDVWVENGIWLDPFRPQIQPGGFASHREFALDRARHFAAVRRAFETLDVLVFTLGLTEAWTLRADGAVFTICPGTSGGVFDPARHEFRNFTVMDVVEDLTSFTAALRRRNPKARLILTVSPVPLVATARADTHVLAATTYSKAVLRVAAETTARLLPDVMYFPSYEIVMSRAYDAGTYFGPDRREVLGPGVAHVLRVFAETFAGFKPPAAPAPVQPTGAAYTAQMAALMKVQCDELALDQS